MAALLAGVVTGQACRYNVRDTGFVDFETAPYRLIVLTNAITRADWIADLRAATAEAWLDTNVRLEIASAAHPPEVLSGVAIDRENRLPGFLVFPGGHVESVALPDGAKDERAALWSFAESVVVSPLRRQLLDRLPRDFAVVLLAEGPDASANGRARQTIEGSFQRLAARLPLMPKPVEHPPSLLTVPWRKPAPGDAWALHSLGLTASTNRVAPEAAVVYGRGRRCGPPLKGPDLTETALLEALTVLGQDCECDLDRSWLRGPLMPLRWGADQQRQVVAELGFDAESPLVRMEVARIIARGPNPVARRVRFDESGEGSRRGGGGALEALGYAEGGLGDLAALSAAPAATGRTDSAESPLAPPPASPQSSVETETSASPAKGPPSRPAPPAASRPAASMSISFILIAGVVVVVVALVFLFSGKSD